MESPSTRAQLRAGLIALVLIVEGIHALPGRALNEDKLARPEGVRLVAWLERGLSSVGLSPGAKRIRQQLIAASNAGVSARAFALLPFEPLFRAAGMTQQWSLFINVRRECFRMHIDVAGPDQVYAPVYRALAVDLEGLAPLLSYRRLRGIYDPGLKRGPDASYPGFVRYIARRLYADRPERRFVRVAMERLSIGPPGTSPRTMDLEHVVIDERPQP